MIRPTHSVLFCLALGACGGAAPDATRGTADTPRASESAPSYVHKLKFKAADAAGSFALKVREDGAKLVDAEEHELARLRVEADGRVKFRDAADNALGSVHGAAPQWHLKDASGAVVFQLVRQDDGDLKVQDGGGALLFRVKVRDYGAEIETPDDRSLFKAKRKDGGLSIRDAADTTVLRSNDQGDAQAAALLVLPGLTLPQRVALWYVVEPLCDAARRK